MVPQTTLTNVQTSQDSSFVVGAPTQETVNQNLRTRRTKAIINFALEDFSRIHAQFMNKNRPAYVETPVYAFFDNEKIKFQINKTRITENAKVFSQGFALVKMMR